MNQRGITYWATYIVTTVAMVVGGAIVWSKIDAKWHLKDWFDVNVTCAYQDAVGTCITQDWHIRILAQQAAIDQTRQLLLKCAPGPLGDPGALDCKLLRSAAGGWG